MLLSTAVSISAVYLPEMRLLVITILVILQRPCQGSEFVLLETESEAERDTGNMEGSEPASSSNGDYQDVSNQAKFGCQDCKIDMRPVYGHTPCTGCEEGNPQGSSFSCRSCVSGELPKFKCDSCQMNRRNWKGIGRVIVDHFGYSDDQFRYYELAAVMPTPMFAEEICESVGLRWVCDIAVLQREMVNGITGRRFEIKNGKRTYKEHCDIKKHTLGAMCANRIQENPICKGRRGKGCRKHIFFVNGKICEGSGCPI